MQSFVVRVCFFPRAATSFSLSVCAFLFGLLDAKFSRRVCVLLIGLLQGLSLCGRVSHRAATKRFFLSHCKVSLCVHTLFRAAERKVFRRIYIVAVLWL